MTIKYKVLIAALLLSTFITGMVQTAHAYTFYIDDFSVSENGSVIFDDTFSDGTPPRVPLTS